MYALQIPTKAMAPMISPALRGMKENEFISPKKEIDCGETV